MSIWTELLFLHGHVATPLALALVTAAGSCPTAPAAPEPAAQRPEPEPAGCTAASPVHHPLRVAGQLR